jgi:exosortase
MDNRLTNLSRQPKHLLHEGAHRLAGVFAEAVAAGRRIVEFEPHWIWVGIPFAALMIFAYHLTWMTWFGFDQTLCFQPFVPFAVAYAIYLHRAEVQYTYEELISVYQPESAKRHGNILPAFAGCLLILVSAVSSLTQLSVIGFVVTVVGIVYYIYGFQILRVVWQPLLYLIFMIPPPTGTMTVLMQHLQIGSAVVAGQFLQLVMSDVHVRGTFIMLPNYVLEVSAPCSGLSIIFPVFVLTAFLALFKRMHLSLAGILLVISVIIAVAMNVLRIVVMGLIGGVNPTLASALHDSNSLIFAGLSFYLAFLAAGLMLRPPKRRRSEFEQDLLRSIEVAEQARNSGEDAR